MDSDPGQRALLCSARVEVRETDDTRCSNIEKNDIVPAVELKANGVNFKIHVHVKNVGLMPHYVVEVPMIPADVVIQGNFTRTFYVPCKNLFCESSSSSTPKEITKTRNPISTVPSCSSGSSSTTKATASVPLFSLGSGSSSTPNVSFGSGSSSTPNATKTVPSCSSGSSSTTKATASVPPFFLGSGLSSSPNFSFGSGSSSTPNATKTVPSCSSGSSSTTNATTTTLSSGSGLFDFGAPSKRDCTCGFPSFYFEALTPTRLSADRPDRRLASFRRSITRSFHGTVDVYAAPVRRPDNPVVADLTYSAMRNQGLLTDVRLRAAGEEFLAHSVVLAVASPVLRGLLTREPREDNVVDVEGVRTPSVFRAFLDYVYSGRLPEQCKSLELVDVLGLADRYGVSALTGACLARLRTVGADGALGVLRAAHEVGHVPDEVLEHVTGLVLENLEDLTLTQEWAELSTAMPAVARSLKASHAAYKRPRVRSSFGKLRLEPSSK